MISVKTTLAVAGLFAFVNAQLNNFNTIIDYNVIKLLNETETMGVVVDNVTYPLDFNKNVSKVLFTGKAPAAKNGYQYVKITKANNNTEAESFLRQPTESNTVNEFFNRTWNTRELAQLPVVYEPLPVINRIHTDLHIDGEIPTMHLIANQTEVDLMHHSNSTEDYKIKSNMTYISLKDTLNYEDVEISLAGRSSRWMPKLSYNVKLDKKDRIYQTRRVKLRALDTDPSYIREQLAYDVLKSVGLLSSEFSFIRVFMNEKELGLFGIIETFQDPWIANSFANGSTSYKQGNLYQGVFQSPASGRLNHTSDLSYYNNVTAYADGQYKVKADATKGKKSPDYEPLMKFTKFIETAPTNTSDAVDVWNSKLDTDSFLRSMALEVLLGYADGYLAMADNYYLYDNLNTSQMFFVSSDMDLTFGSTMFNISKMWSGNYSTFPQLNTRPLMNKILQVPAFKQLYQELLVNISKSLVNPTIMNNRINDLQSMLTEDVEWDEQLARVAKNLLASIGEDMSPSNIDPNVAGAVGSQFPPDMDMSVMLDFGKRLNESIPFDIAVNGPTGYKSLAGVKEWVQTQNQAILNFYNETSS
ncbi:unnamed protein product [Mucor hiemalis]